MSGWRTDILWCIVSVFILTVISCSSAEKNRTSNFQGESIGFKQQDSLKLVLAQWTYNKSLFSGEISTVGFIDKAKSLGFVGVELVNQFFKDKVDDITYLTRLKDHSLAVKMPITLLAIDIEKYQLGSSNKEEREKAVALHKKWIDAAHILASPTVRVNAHGSGSSSEVREYMMDAIIQLANYGKMKGVSIVIENHGQLSSDGQWLSSLVGELVPYGVGSVADFDNWCIERENGQLWGAPCINEYDRYKGMKELLPTAKSISVKAFGFDEYGEAVKTDFKKMIQLIKDSQYDEYLAVEFEGHDITPEEGISKTIRLIKKYY